MSDPSLHALDKRLTSHEEVCAERYGGIIARIGRLEKVLVGATGSIIAGLVFAVWQLSHLGVK
jgi:hypothetical protein